LYIPTGSNGNVEFEMFRSTIFTPDFNVITATSNNFPVLYNSGLHYWGIVKNDNSSLASISIFDNEVMGIVSTVSGNFVIGKINPNNQNKHIFYNDKNLMIQNKSSCNTVDDFKIYKKEELELVTNRSPMQQCIRLYWEVNYDIYLDKGSVTNTTNYITGLFNETAILYANDNIPVSLSQIYIWNIASPYNSTSTSGLLGQFQSYRTSYSGDLGHLLGFGGGGGIAAGFSGLCASNVANSQCYSGINSTYSTLPLYSWSVEVVTHEQGHLMGSRHTHACVWNGNSTAIDGCAGFVEGGCALPGYPSNGGTIMSYCHQILSVGINFINGFGVQPQAVILNNYSNASCLSNCTGVGCFVSNNLSSINVSTNAATLNWDSVANANSYNIQYRIVGNSTWTIISSLLNTINLTSLLPGNTYEWQVQTVCNSGFSSYSYVNQFTTIPLVCTAPVNLNLTGIGSTIATLNWGSVQGAISYNIEYREIGTTNWINATSLINSHYLINLNPTTNYEWMVQSVCAGGGLSSFSLIDTLTTLLTPQPVACYPFSGNANDASGNNHNGIVYGPMLTTDRFGNANSAYSFDGINDSISLGLYGNIIPSGNDFTMGVWVQDNQVKLSTILMINPDISSDRLNASVYYSHNGASYTFWDYGSISNNGRLLIANTVFSPNWEHYVFISNHTQNYMEIYKNGQLQQHKPGSSVISNRNRSLHIGGAYDVVGAPFFFSGKIDDMVIYDQVLSQQEIQTLFSQTTLCLSTGAITDNTIHAHDILFFPTVSANGQFQLELKGINLKEKKCAIFNSIGIQVYSFTLLNNQNNKTLELSNLAKGVYYLRIMTEAYTKNIKFIIQ
jgi:hypothetical protein